MAQIQTKYITPDEFRDYFGIDLAVIKDDTNPSNKQMAFLKRIEDRMETYIDSNCFRKVSVEYPNFSDYQKEHYKRALLEQAIYVFRNGDMSVDSGIDPEKGVVIDSSTLKRMSLAPNAKMELQLCGLWSKKIRMSDWAGSGLWSV
jgi:hypothetical protein